MTDYPLRYPVLVRAPSSLMDRIRATALRHGFSGLALVAIIEAYTKQFHNN